MSIQHVSAVALRDWLAHGSDAPLLLDVREPWEIAICALPGSTNIPMGEIPSRASELPTDREVVVVCHHGVRSLRVAHYLAERGYTRIYNLTGGVDAWANDVDPDFPVY